MLRGIGLVSWKLVYTNKAKQDAKKLKSSGLRPIVEELLNLLKDDPFKRPPPYEKLVGDLNGAYSRRINIQHRLVYQVIEEQRTVKIIRMWTHYEGFELK
jgi:toxin YoeB